MCCVDRLNPQPGAASGRSLEKQRETPMIRSNTYGYSLNLSGLGVAVAIFWALLITPSTVQATKQIRDEIRVGDRVFALCAPPPLNPYFAQHLERDLGDLSGEVLANYESCAPDSKGELIEVRTDLHRGYVATLAIVEGRLVVEQIWTSIFDIGKAVPVIDCAMPEPESRYLTWYSGPLYYVAVDPVESNGKQFERYSLNRVDIKKGKAMDARLLRSEVHGPLSWLYCSFDWSNDTNKGPIEIVRCYESSDNLRWCVPEEVE